MPRKPKTPLPARVRELHAGGVALESIAAQLRADGYARVRPSEITRAIEHDRGVGQPAKPGRVLRIRVPPELEPYLKLRYEEGVYSGDGDVLLAAAEAELVPEVEMMAYIDRKRGG